MVDSLGWTIPFVFQVMGGVCFTCGCILFALYYAVGRKLEKKLVAANIALKNEYYENANPSESNEMTVRRRIKEGKDIEYRLHNLAGVTLL